MRYDYKCPECGTQVEKIHSMKVSPEVLCECGAQMQRVIYGGTGVIFKGNGWTTKNIRVKGQMAKRRADIKSRQEKPGEMLPNVGGDVVDTWTDAAHLAHERDVDPLSHIAKAVRQGEDLDG